MEITKNDIIKLIRNDLKRQRSENNGKTDFIRINDVAFPVNRNIKWWFGDGYVAITCNYILVATVWYDSVTSIGYTYHSKEHIKHSLKHMVNGNID